MQQINRPYEGLFITIEGGDGCGKTTLGESLAKELEKKGYKVVKTREPGGAPLSEEIRKLLLTPPSNVKIGAKAELLLYLAARAEHVEAEILPALRQGKVVICERFNDSTIAYQGCARNLGMHFVEKLCQLLFEGVIEPNCTLFLDIDPEIGRERIRSSRKTKSDRLENEEVEFHRLVRQGFLHLADEYPNRVVVLDAELSPDKILALSLQALEPFLMLKPAKS